MVPISFFLVPEKSLDLERSWNRYRLKHVCNYWSLPYFLTTKHPLNVKSVNLPGSTTQDILVKSISRQEDGLGGGLVGRGLHVLSAFGADRVKPSTALLCIVSGVDDSQANTNVRDLHMCKHKINSCFCAVQGIFKTLNYSSPIAFYSQTFVQCSSDSDIYLHFIVTKYVF